MAATPDPYQVLGLTVASTRTQLDQAFRALVRRLHPDTRSESRPDPQADRLLQEVLVAYAVLRDPARRAAYDRAHPQPSVAPGPTAPRPRLFRQPPAIRFGPTRWEPPDRSTFRSCTT
ncbi:J domain-containing protein [Kribbella sp. NPDC051620]|uniref:J domain-containing protein n=1 Tax=Kribbella sp. NPDC051620 TaxID=3364120 RepID=UPI00379CEA15